MFSGGQNQTKEAQKECKRDPQVFLNAPLSYIAAQILNLSIKKILEEEGFSCIFPQEILPPGTDVNPVKVFSQNTDFVKKCDVVLSVLDAPGEGVLFELGYAYALCKPIVAFRSNGVGYLGKVIEGLWKQLPESQKATTLEELRCKLRGFRSSWK
jgi:nucleoside 2-deoxyribosyltransferase